MFKNESSEGMVTSFPIHGQLGISYWIGTCKCSIKVFGETLLIGKHIKAMVHFKPIQFVAVQN